MPTKLRKLVINEISLVSKGANPHAFITLCKRDVPDIETPRDSDPLHFNASGRGPMHDKLFTAYDNYRRGMGSAQASSAFQLAWDDLTDDEKQTIRDEEAATEAAKLAAAAAAEAERKKEMMKTMNDSKLEDIVKLAHDVDAGRMGHYADRSTWYRAITKAAETQRKPNESVQQSFARYITEDADGKAMYRCLKTASGSDYVPLAPTAPVAKVNPANDQIREAADVLMRADPDLTRYAALLKVHAERPELLAKAKAFA